MEVINLPEDNLNVMVTYKKTFYFGAYNSESRIETVTKMGFYSKLFNNFAVPPRYAYFRIGKENVLLPDGFGGDHLPIEKVIKWEYCK